MAGPEVSLDEWNKLIEKDLFAVRTDASGVSGRTMLSFLVRRASAHGFNQATESFSKQRKADAATNLAYLLGLDYELADGYRKLSAQKATLVRSCARQLMIQYGGELSVRPQICVVRLPSLKRNCDA